MLTTFTDAWSSTSSLGGNFGDVIESERTERFELQEVVTLHKIYDPYVSKNLKREPTVMAS